MSARWVKPGSAPVTLNRSGTARKKTEPITGRSAAPAPSVKPAAGRVAAALRYGPRDKVPVVSAKGRGEIAQQILNRAQEAGVPIHQSEMLAAMLMQVELDRQIPPQLYRVVAELLAWLYRLEKMRESGQTNSPAAGPPPIPPFLP